MIGSQYPSPCLKKLAEFPLSFGIFALLSQRRCDPVPSIQSLWMIWGQGSQLPIENLTEFGLRILQSALLRQYACDMVAHVEDLAMLRTQPWRLLYDIKDL